MTRSQLLVLLQIDQSQSEDIRNYEDLIWLENNGYVSDDGCETFVTAKGDLVINAALSVSEGLAHELKINSIQN